MWRKSSKKFSILSNSLTKSTKTGNALRSLHRYPLAFAVAFEQTDPKLLHYLTLLNLGQDADVASDRSDEIAKRLLAQIRALLWKRGIELALPGTQERNDAR